jgi:hypothetical protein
MESTEAAITKAEAPEALFYFGLDFERYCYRRKGMTGWSRVVKKKETLWTVSITMRQDKQT